MYWRVREPRFDVASALSPGQREYQEDAVIADFPIGMEFGYTVLADGMGGHAAGDVASKIILTEVFSEIKFSCSNLEGFEADMSEILREAAESANACVRAHIAENPADRGMGSTLVAPVFIEDRLFWISIGDSPLYLLRDGKLQQLNEDHSMAPQIDIMVKSGLMDPEVGRDHPDRNCPTSVLCGDAIKQVDCPDEPFQLLEDDIVVVSSDGLQFLTNEEIESILVECKSKPSAEIADTLLRAIEDLGDPDQDNLSLSVVKVNHTRKASQQQADDGFENAKVAVVNGGAERRGFLRSVLPSMN